MNIHPLTRQAYQLLHQGVLAFSEAEQQGMRIDMDYCQAKSQELSDNIDSLENEFRDTNFYKHWKHSFTKTPNIHSNQQLSTYLYKIKKITPVKTTISGGGATDEEALKQLGIPELEQLLRIRKLKKLKDTYLQSFIREQVNGYIHPFFNLHTVRTFRSSSDRPNFQNIPKRDKEAMDICRRAIFPRPGNQLMEVDFGSLEVRIAACYHKDPTMLKYIQDSSTCMHRDMAQQLYFINDFNPDDATHMYLRAAVKNGFVFPQFYGDYYKNCAVSMIGTWGQLPLENRFKKGQGVSIGDKALSDHLISNGIRSLDNFTDHVQKIETHFWGTRFPKYKRWKDKWWRQYQKQGYVDMLTGFRCGGLMSKNDAINYPVQGAAFHCLLWCFIKLCEYVKYYKMGTKAIGQIHDAIVLDIVPSELENIRELVIQIMTVDIHKQFPWIIVPLKIDADLTDIDESWAQIKKYSLIT